MSAREPSEAAIEAMLRTLDMDAEWHLARANRQWSIPIAALRAAYAVDVPRPPLDGEALRDLLDFLDACAAQYNSDTGESGGGRPGHLARTIRDRLAAAPGATP